MQLPEIQGDMVFIRRGLYQANYMLLLMMRYLQEFDPIWYVNANKFSVMPLSGLLMELITRNTISIYHKNQLDNA